MSNFSDQVAIVTGASRGIGKSITETLAKSGAHVYLLSRSQNAVSAVSEDLNSQGWSTKARACDVSDFDQVQSVFKSIAEEAGGIHILVNNAGVTRDTLLLRMTEADWDFVLDINLKGAFNGIKAVVRPMMKNRFGRIINISSVVGLTGNAGQINYAASKSGLLGLTKSTARELASRNITVNCIAPGYIETDMTGSLAPEAKENLIKQIPLGRIGTGSDIAELVRFLAGDQAGYITGQTFAVDGGMTMI
ncbi:MAG: 3-oxoacyl-[acyl-carrier-protein] reductase [FCB group bacterium]|nr:3-oxoacyl-[acyl-carrier-protein] reductase [FCB group bacterium]